jgi:thiamine-monophosphate kinase
MVSTFPIARLSRLQNAVDPQAIDIYKGRQLNIADDTRTLRQLGERAVVQSLTDSLKPSPLLLDGFGHDAAFLDLSVADGEVLVVNTDRSGLNIAYQLGLAGAECVGDLGVSHAISDIVAAGGQPMAVTVALLLPPDTELGFVRKVMQGAEKAAARYGAIIAGGDTKQNPKFAIVVTAIGTVHRDKRLLRSSAQPGDSLAVTGHLGSMLLGTIAFRKKLELPSDVLGILEGALVNQNPPFKLGRAIANAGIANACIDISDGLPGALFAICSASGVGAIIDESKLPIDPALERLAQSLDLRPIQLTLGGGDWQFLYSIPTHHLAEVEEIANQVGASVTIVGKVVAETVIAARTIEGHYQRLNRIEHDSFIDGLGGVGYFDALGFPQQCFGDPIDVQFIESVLSR